MAVILSPERKEALEKINFVKRYRDLCNNHKGLDDSLENYDIVKVTEIIKSFGYDAVKYYKSEKFFKVDEVSKKDFYKISFNISLSYGLCEFIWGSPWDYILDLLDIDSSGIESLAFHSYDELRNILAVAFEMYEDYKKELIAIYETSAEE